MFVCDGNSSEVKSELGVPALPFDSSPLKPATMPPHSHILGVILAGGGSRRMFANEPTGGDKALVEIHGAPMLAHVIKRFAPQVPRLILNANGDPARYAAFGLDVIADTLALDAPTHLNPDIKTSGHGPLAGLLAAMEWAGMHAPQTTSIATVSTDVPFLPLTLVQELTAAASAGKIVLAQSGEHVQPAIGLWPVALAEDLKKTLLRGERRAKAFAERYGAIAVSFPFVTIAGREVDPFFNANTPEDMRTARHVLTGQT